MTFYSVSGQILWRRILEKGSAGKIRYLGGVADGELVSVSGGVPAIVRAWDLASGHILNVWPVAEQNPDRYDVQRQKLICDYLNLQGEKRFFEKNSSRPVVGRARLPQSRSTVSYSLLVYKMK